MTSPTSNETPDVHSGGGQGNAKAIFFLLAAAFACVAAGYQQVSHLLEGLAFGNQPDMSSFFSSLCACATALVVVAMAARFSRQGRFLILAGALLAGAVALTIAGWMAAHLELISRPLAITLVLVCLFAEAAATGLGVGLCIESSKSGARSAAILGTTVAGAALITFLAGFLAKRFNQDWLSPTSFTFILGLVSTLTAAVALPWVLMEYIRQTSGAARQPQVGVLSALEDVLQNAPARLMAIGFVVQVIIVSGVQLFGYLLLIEKGFHLTSDALMLPKALSVIGAVCGAIIVDRWRHSQFKRTSLIAFWAAFVAAVFYVFALNVDNVSQSFGFLSIAVGVGAIVWAPSLVMLNDYISLRNRPVSIALIIFLIGSFEAMGLPQTFGELIIRSVGGINWKIDLGFWGSLAFNNIKFTKFLLPFQFNINVTDPMALKYTTQTACLIMSACLVAPIAFYGLAARSVGLRIGSRENSSPDLVSAAQPSCPRCGAGNRAANRFCQQCGGPLEPAAIAMTAISPSWNPLGAIILGLVATVVVICAAMVADAEGVLHKKWSSGIVWKAPDSANQAIKDCKDHNCLISVMKANHAPAEGILFVDSADLQNVIGQLGYPTAFNGTGKVKVVEFFEPGLGMDGTVEFIFVNGTKAVMHPADNIELAAHSNSDYQNLKIQYPNVTPWDGLVFNKEVLSADGSQKFEFKQTLLNGCHACAVVGSLDISYNFDNHGHYLGMSILGVETDKDAAYGALRDRLEVESQFVQDELLQLQADGKTLTGFVREPQSGNPLAGQIQTILQEKEHCRFSIKSIPVNMAGGYSLLDNTFNLKDVTIKTELALETEAALVANSPPPSVPANNLVVLCKSSGVSDPRRECVSQDYTYKIGHAEPMPAASFTVPVENVASVIRDFQALQAMCA